MLDISKKFSTLRIATAEATLTASPATIARVRAQDIPKGDPLPVAKVAADARPWMILGFLGLVVTGIPQLMQNAMREYFSEFFWLKMYVIPVALIFTFTIRQRVAMADESRVAPVMSKLTGLVSILLWIGGVAVPARLIGLFT